MEDFYGRLDELYSAGDRLAIEAFILDAVADTREGSPERAGLYNELAGFYRGISRFDESEDTFSRALGIFEASGTPEYATVLLNLAGLYRIAGDADKAIQLFHTAKERLEFSGGRGSYAYISVLNNLALAYQGKNEYIPALEYAGKALELMRAGSGGGHEIAASLNNLAAIRLGMGENGAAEALVSEALGIYGGMAETDVHHAAALTTSAVILCRKGDYSGALDGFRQSLELTSRFFGENVEFAICKRNIADVYELLGDIHSAATEMHDAARILERIHGADHPVVLDAQTKLKRLRDSGEKNER
jgi:tetratricopeptide (TPR) repeat protein